MENGFMVHAFRVVMKLLKV